MYAVTFQKIKFTNGTTVSHFGIFHSFFLLLKQVFEHKKVAKMGQLNSKLSGPRVKSGALGPMAQSKTLQVLKLGGRQSLHYQNL